MYMTPVQIVFLLIALVTLVAAVLTVTTRKVLHAALWLVVSLFGVAAVFALLQAGFFAVIQVVVYIGAIAILIIFAVMLTRRVMQDTGTQLAHAWWVAGGATLLLLGGLVAALSRWPGFNALPPDYSEPAQNATIAQLGQALVSPQAFVLPFEVASVLLLAALVGAIYIARERK
jgi:NADH-quinone oxidoreductase subunit J